MALIGTLDVFVVRRHSGDTRPSARLKMACLSLRSSAMFSLTSAAPSRHASSDVVYLIVTGSFDAASINDRDVSRVRSLREYTATEYRAANTLAIPDPIVPAPITATFSGIPVLVLLNVR